MSTYKQKLHSIHTRKKKEIKPHRCRKHLIRRIKIVLYTAHTLKARAQKHYISFFPCYQYSGTREELLLHPKKKLGEVRAKSFPSPGPSIFLQEILFKHSVIHKGTEIRTMKQKQLVITEIKTNKDSVYVVCTAWTFKFSVTQLQ